MPQLAAAAQRAHRESVESTIEDVVKYLEEVLGRRLVTYMAGVTDSRAVTRWANGERKPRAESEERLRGAYQVFQLLLAEEAPHTVRAWFMGLNPQLDDESPARAIQDGRIRDVLVAAKAFLSGG